MASLRKEPRVIPGGIAVDDRGQLTFAQGFEFEGVRRFYLVENFSTNVVRAFHGHLKEEKFVIAVCGSALVIAVAIDDAARPCEQAKLHRVILSSRQPGVLHIPAGYANGFRPLEAATKLIFFSTATLEQSVKDDYRFGYDQWGAGIWEVQNR